MRVGPVLGLIVAAVLGASAAAQAAEAVLVGEFTWRSRDPKFGGISGLILQSDNVTFRVVEDTGFTFTGKLKRNGDGAVTGLAMSSITRLRDEKGRRLEEEDWDSEGIAAGPGDSFFVSFERNDRIARYANYDAPSEVLTKGLDLSWVTYNKGFEALAIDKRSRLWAIVENPLSRAAGHPVYRMDGGVWSVPFSIPAKGTWRVTDADFGPEGKLYVLERDFWGLVGFRTRVLRLTIDGDRLAGIETLLETQAGKHDNLEGLAVWKDASGATRLTMVSDDNHNLFQKTEIVDYRIVE